jgi:hypothetical protein
MLGLAVPPQRNDGAGFAGTESPRSSGVGSMDTKASIARNLVVEWVAASALPLPSGGRASPGAALRDVEHFGALGEPRPANTFIEKRGGDNFFIRIWIEDMIAGGGATNF